MGPSSFWATGQRTLLGYDHTPCPFTPFFGRGVFFGHPKSVSTASELDRFRRPTTMDSWPSEANENESADRLTTPLQARSAPFLSAIAGDQCRPPCSVRLHTRLHIPHSHRHTPDTFFEKIATILSTKKGIDKESILIESSFEELGLDSLDAVELISDLEDEFNVTIPNVELQSIKTIQQAVDGLQKAMGS